MKKIIFLSFVAACTFLGCSPVVYTYDLKTGKLERRHVSNVGDAMFMNTVNIDIKAELKSKEFPDGINWHDHWIHRCEQIHYSPGMGDPYIQYIIDKRREAGLPDIPKIDKRQFRSEWQIFTDKVDKQTDREIKGFPPPAIVFDQTWVKTWPDYWKVTERLALRNPAVSTKGVEYINEHRKQTGLPPLN